MTKMTKTLMIGSAIAMTCGAFAAGVAGAKTAAKEPVISLLSEAKWIPLMKEGPVPAVALIQGDPMKGGYFAFLKLPANFTSPPHAHTSDYWAVLIQGKMTHWSAVGGSEAASKQMSVGDSAFMPAKVEHISKCYPGADCIMAMMQKGKNDFIMGKTPPAAPAAAAPVAPAPAAAAPVAPKAAAPAAAPVVPKPVAPAAPAPVAPKPAK
jgi:hypothetical protein